MKTLALTSAAILTLTLTGLAADKKAATTPAPAPAPATGTAPAPAAPTAPAAAPGEKAEDKTKSDRPLPMRSRVDAIDAATKSWIQKRKDGVEVKHVVTSKTDIRNANQPAKFTDIKVGDYVNGSRLKKSPTEYEVVKITKIGAAPAKKEKEAEKAEE